MMKSKHGISGNAYRSGSVGDTVTYINPKGRQVYIKKDSFYRKAYWVPSLVSLPMSNQTTTACRSVKRITDNWSTKKV